MILSMNTWAASAGILRSPNHGCILPVIQDKRFLRRRSNWITFCGVSLCSKIGSSEAVYTATQYNSFFVLTGRSFATFRSVVPEI
eukprot:3940318-Rhodomonas_salina.1